LQLKLVSPSWLTIDMGAEYANGMAIVVQVSLQPSCRMVADGAPQADLRAGW
jgi:hypothetical protein